MTAPTETPSLTTERATELAARWAEAHGRGASRPAVEREQLFAWVRAKAEKIHDPAEGWKMTVAKIGGELRLPDSGAVVGLGMLQRAEALCEAAGWPS